MSQRSTRSSAAAAAAGRLPSPPAQGGTPAQQQPDKGNPAAPARKGPAVEDEVMPMEGVTDEREAALAAGGRDQEGGAQASASQEQLLLLTRMLQQQALQIDELRASPHHSPPQQPQQSPQRPLPGLDGPRAAAASPPAEGQQSRFARKEPRAQDLREYDGAAGAKLDEWLQELSLATYLYRLNTLEASSFGVSRLRGAALQWWLAMSVPQQEALTDPSALGAALRARFQPVTAARLAREQLDRLQQGSRPVNDYIADFQRLHTQLPSMAEEDALYAFERGLRRELAERLRVQGVNNLPEAIALAARVGGLLQASASPHSRAAAAATQMEIDDGSAGGALDDRIAKAVLAAMQAQQGAGQASGLGAKSQTQRGYREERSSAGRGGRTGPGSRGMERQLPRVPGVPPAVVEQRRAAGQCYRCGSGDHTSRECPNATSAAQPSSSF